MTQGDYSDCRKKEAADGHGRSRIQAQCFLIGVSSVFKMPRMPISRRPSFFAVCLFKRLQIIASEDVGLADPDDGNSTSNSSNVLEKRLTRRDITHSDVT
jgi:hypothetical protein